MEAVLAGTEQAGAGDTRCLARSVQKVLRDSMKNNKNENKKQNEDAVARRAAA